MFIPYDIADGMSTSFTIWNNGDMRQHLLKLNIFYIICTGYLCVLKKKIKTFGKVLYLLIQANSKVMGDWQSSSETKYM